MASHGKARLGVEWWSLVRQAEVWRSEVRHGEERFGKSCHGKMRFGMARIFKGFLWGELYRQNHV
jgi:hypothetical protein